MTGGSLGLRTGSYGSLQQHLQNNSVSPLQISPAILRKPQKMLLSSSREKEKILSKIFKFAGRRSFGMLVVVVICVVVCMTVLAAIFKVQFLARTSHAHYNYHLHVTIGDHHHPDDVASDGVDPSPTTLNLQNIPNDSMSSNYPQHYSITGGHDNKGIDGDQNKGNSTILPNIVKTTGKNVVCNLLPTVVGSTLLPGHPCYKFAVPPPPADRKRTGPRPCPVCYLPVEQAILQMPSCPSTSPVLANLTYVHEENSVRTESFGGSDFGGYPSLKQRNDSFDIKESMNVHCGFVKGSKPGRQTGFDINDADLFEMEQCHGIAVASAIFGNYDVIQQPKNISEAAKKNVCFYMFVDEETEAYMKNSSALDEKKKVGIWRIVVVHNLPYIDARRNGKVPKLLLHRIFPNARYSIWLDGKLELVVDPYQILERFLWRTGATFAISRHYKRFDVFEEAEANKAAGKYDNATIDFQVEFYKREGLTPYSEAKLPITSDVPEGCVIIKEHIPITNLFTCLWFNEVDRFTSRDQISFSTVRDKIMSKVNWTINMFLDCERRNFVVQAYHKDLLEKMAPPAAVVIHPPPVLTNEPRQKSLPGPVLDRAAKIPVKKAPSKRGKDRKSGSRRHRKTSAGIKDANSI